LHYASKTTPKGSKKSCKESSTPPKGSKEDCKEKDDAKAQISNLAIKTPVASLEDGGFDLC
jgi:hypothetical protein